MTYTSRFGSRHGLRRTEFNGYKYDSKLEARVAKELEERKQSGEFVHVDNQYRIKLYVYLPNGEKVDLFTYICDFRCHRSNGTYVLVEAKGHLTEIYRTKRKILDLVWLPDHPEYEFEEIRSK